MKPILAITAVVATAAAIIAPIVAPILAQSTAITLYTGRSQALVEPIIKQFEADTKIKVNVRYATDAALVAALQEEGSRSSADVFWANTSGALGQIADAKLFRKLPESISAKAAKDFAPDTGLWVPVSVRSRVLAYNNKTVKPEDLPTSILDLAKLAKFKGKIGWTPTYGSFQEFLGVLIQQKGEAAAKAWLDGMKELQPKSYAASNTAMMEGIKNGEIEVAFTNHYYIQRFVKSGASIGTHYFAKNDPGALVLVTGAGSLQSSKNSINAQRFVRYLLEPKIQQFFPGELFEYPVVKGAILPNTLLPLSELLGRSPKVDWDKTATLVAPAQKLLREAGLL
jgi:iron(III) transport system substrate-binding protein